MTCQFFELPGEVKGIFKAYLSGDFGNAKSIVGEKVFGLVNAESMDVLQRRHAEGFFEDMGKAISTGAAGMGQLGNGEVGVEVLFDVFHGLFD